MILEITVKGFDGGTDETDNLVLWIACRDKLQLRQALFPVEQLVQRVWDQVSHCDEDSDAVDFQLPGQANALQAKVKALAA